MKRDGKRNSPTPFETPPKTNYANPSRENVRFTRTQSKNPNRVGMIMARAVHFKLPVSFFMVRQVVEQGQWKRQKINMHRAVFKVQPLSVSRVKRAAESVISTK